MATDTGSQLGLFGCFFHLALTLSLLGPWLVFVLVLGALILPLFGVSLGSVFGSDSTGSGYGAYGFDQTDFNNAYESSANAYNSFSKR